MNIIYLGNNNPLKFKRGVENVIYSQAAGFDFGKKYYIFFDDRDCIFRWNDIICISIKKGVKKIFKLNYVIKRLKQKEDAIIHSHGPVRTLLSLYTTDILTVHDAIYYQRKGLNQKFYHIFYLIEKFAYLRSKRIHFISNYAKEQSLYKYKGKDKSFIVYNTTPLESDILKHQISSNNLLSEQDYYYTLFAVRGIQERTRIDLLIDFADFCKNRLIIDKKIRILIAGKGPLLEHYRNIIKEKGLRNINLLGYIPDIELSDYYNRIDCVIITCDHAEGFGLPIIEGYCSNKPVIGSNHCAVPEIIIDPAFLFENNPQSVFDTLTKIKSLDYNYNEYYQNNFSNQIYTSQFHTIYLELISKQK